VHDNITNANKIHNNKISERHQQSVISGVESGVKNYIRSRKDKIPGFINTHFSLQGSLRMHRKALGKDLYKAPLNILWIVPTLLTRAASAMLNKLGSETMARRLDRIPAGFETDVQKEITWLIYSELLELPYQQGDRQATKDALLESILDTPEISTIISGYLAEIHQKSGDPKFRKSLEKNFQEYASSRAAAADIASSIITLASGAVAFHKLTPGALMSGSAVAAVIAEKLAIANFWLGPSLGAWYYSVFPATASTGLLVAATSSVIATLALLSSFTGILTDPVQLKLGIHQKRLEKFLDALANELLDKTASPYKIKDLYITRVFDLFDILITAIKS